MAENRNIMIVLACTILTIMAAIIIKPTESIIVLPFYGAGCFLLGSYMETKLSNSSK